MKKIRAFIIVLLIILFAGFVFYSTRKTSAKTPPINIPEEIKVCAHVFSGADSFLKELKPLPYYSASWVNPRTRQKELIGIIYSTKDIVPHIKGYTGPIDLMVAIDKQGVIKCVQILSHEETGSYVERLDSFIEQFISLRLGNAFEVGKDIDGMTQATITSEAIARIIKESFEIVTNRILSQSIVEKTEVKRSSVRDVDSSKIRTKLKEAGLEPHNARYWTSIE